MSNTCIRSLYSGNNIDVLNGNDNCFSLGVTGNESPILPRENPNSYIAIKLTENAIITSNIDTMNLRYADLFTICFWFKFPKKAITDTVYPNKIVLVMNDGSKPIDMALPDTMLDNEWHYISIGRNGSDITYRLDGATVTTVASSAVLDFTDKSFLYLGNNNKNATGFDVVIDDLIIIDTEVYSSDYTLLTEYVDVSNFKNCLYIKVSTGEVWGYKED